MSKNSALPQAVPLLDTIEITDPNANSNFPHNQAKNSTFDSEKFTILSQVQTTEKEIENNFQERKLKSLKLAETYNRLGLDKRAKKVEECGSFLEFKINPTETKLFHANFCKDRFCPMCNWRRSLKIFGQVQQIVDEIKDNYEFLFLTLTVKNCSASDLAYTIDQMYNGFRYLYNKNKVFKTSFKGTFRNLEITYNRVRHDFHPHFHIVIAVEKNYFKSKDYLKQADIVKLWRKALNVHYDPIVYIEKVLKTGKGLSGVVAEIAKYMTKDIEYICNPYILSSYLAALPSHRRLTSMTGIIKRIAKQLSFDDCENGDLIHTDNINSPSGFGVIVRCVWNSNKYILSYFDM